MLVLEAMKKPTKQQSRLCRYSHQSLNYLTQIAVDNKLHSIKSILGEWRPAFRTNRKVIVLAILRIGNSFITHSYLLKREEQPTSVPYDTPFTIKYIFTALR